MTIHDVEALADAVGVLHHPDPPITLCDVAVVVVVLASVWSWLLLVSMIV